MSILKELLPGQHIRIDNHLRGVPMRWDWEPNEQPEDIHLDKEMNRRVNGKKVQIRVTLNKDGGVNMPHKKYSKDTEWMDEYNRVKAEVKNVLENDAEKTRGFVESVRKAIIEIGPHKKRRAVEMALERIGKFFGLDASSIEMMTDEAKELSFLYTPTRQQQFYMAFDDDHAFYLGEGGRQAFLRHSRVTWLWRNMCRSLERCPTLQDFVNYYLNAVGEKTKEGMEDELNFVATVINSKKESEEKKAETLLIPESHPDCPVRRTHLWRLKGYDIDKKRIIRAIVENNLMNIAYGSFDEVMDCVESELLKYSQVGRLAVYDLSKRLWWAQDHKWLGTEYVVLAHGAYAGARCIVGNNKGLGYWTDKSILPRELNQLDSLYIEDFLCVMKKELEILYNV